MGLSERDREILDFERECWKISGSKEDAIRARFGISRTTYYRIVNRIIATRAAISYDPLTVKRLQRARSHRRRTRFEGRRAGPGRR